MTNGETLRAEVAARIAALRRTADGRKEEVWYGGAEEWQIAPFELEEIP